MFDQIAKLDKFVNQKKSFFLNLLNYTLHRHMTSLILQKLEKHDIDN